MIDKVLVNRGLSSLDVLMVALICIGIFETLLGGLRTYTFSHTTTRVDVELGASLFKHLIRLPLSYFGVRRVGDTVARVHELENIRNFLTGSTLTLIIDFFFTIIFFTVMFFYSKTLTLLVLLSIPFYVLLSLFFTPILRSRIDERFRRGAENQCFLVEAVSGVETVKSLAVEPQMQRRWEQQLAAYVGSSFRASHINNIAGQLVQLVQKITMALTLWIGASLVMKGELSVGQLIAFNMLSGRVTQPFCAWRSCGRISSRLKSLLKSCLTFLIIRPKIPKPCPKARCRRLKATWNLRTLLSAMCRTDRRF